LSSEDLRSLLLSNEEASAMDAHGETEASVLVPIYDWPNNPGLVFTRRREELKSHSGEISFPGGRRDPGEELYETALRESDEELALPASEIELVGALPPVGTFVTSYKVFPFVGVIDADVPLTPSPDEVAEVLHLRIDDLVAGYEKKRLVRRGIPFRTDTYNVGDAMVWGATARILALLLERLRPAK
jgi:8-oxo-dGTP pyrophosphatase MutT (NUDIX family)